MGIFDWFRPTEATPSWAKTLLDDQRVINGKVGNIMATLMQVLDLVKAQDTQLDSVRELIVGLKSALDEALSGVTVPTAIQEQIDALFEAATKNSAEITDAINLGTPTPPAA